MLDFSKKLKHLFLIRNLITEIPGNLSDSRLSQISLNENKIKSIDELQLPSTLDAIYLDHNEIEHFSVQSLNIGIGLQYISIVNNKLQIVPNNGISVGIYYLHDNPLACICENSWLINNPEDLNFMVHSKPCSTINHKYPSHQSTLNVNMLCESNFNDSNRCRVKHSKEPDFQCQFECLNPCYCYTTANFSTAIYYCSKSQLQSVPQWVNSGQLHNESKVIIWLDGNNISQLTNVSFIDYYNVIQLYLNNSLIKEMDHFAFNNMTMLILLDLSHNLLTSIKESTFEQLIHLEKLILSNNKLRQLPHNCFDNLNSLKFLYLHENKLTNYPVWKLEKLPSITNLTINNNSWNCNCSFITKFYNFLKLHWEVVPNANEIECIYEDKKFLVNYYYSSKCLSPIENCSIKCQLDTKVSENDKVSINVNCKNPTVFANAKHDIGDVIRANCPLNSSFINAIELTDSNVVKLTEDFFCSFGFYNVNQLILINNQLNNSSKIGFGDMEKSYSSYLSKNKIETMSSSNLPPNLESIDLNHNQIKQIHISKMHVKYLKKINLVNNSLSILPQTDLESNIYNLKENPIACNCENSWLFKYPNPNSMNGQLCQNVNKFNPDNQMILSSNMLCESNYNRSNRCFIEHPIEPHFKCQFECPFPCYCYTTDDFSIAHYYCSNSQLQFVPQWVNSDQLNSKSEIIVWLNRNNFSKIRNENFTDYDNVTQLYLKNSQIISIDHLTFSTMTKLKLLDLSYNQLITIKEGTFNQLINLQKLILSNNIIAYLPDDLFNNTINLTILQLHDNKLKNYSLENLSNRPILKELTLHNNNWTCNCSFIGEFKNYLKYHVSAIPIQNEIYCVNKNGRLATSPVSEYNTSHCTVQQTFIKQPSMDFIWSIAVGIITPLCVFAIVYGVIRCIKSRASAKHVKQIEHAYRLMQNAGTPIETNGKVFDVFISYSNEDSDFVATKIVPKLEDINDPYHVCVHERNFLGGGSIEDTIIEAIKKSTRIIVILTENYMKSDWCMYEFVIAHAVMIEDQCPRVVLIIKDNLPPDINPNLQIYLSTNTYIEWTDSKFWQRLHFALQSNKLPMEQTLQPMCFLMSTRFIMADD
ncbi:TOLL-like receptor [Chamberlinius hualienensis]